MPGKNDEQARVTALALIADQRLVSLRVRACSDTASAIDAAATYFHVPAMLGGDRRIRALSVVLDIAAELSKTAITAFEAGRWYAGLSLIRQLIETEYLLTVFALNPAHASDWLAASAKDLRTWWTPAKMRARSGGTFDDQEYWSHCEHGGHPTPSAVLAVKGNPRPFDQRFWWIDLAGHLRRIFIAMEACFRAFGLDNRLEEKPYVDARLALHEWKAEDPAPDFMLANMPIP